MLSYYRPTLISLFRKVNELQKSPADSALCLEIQEALIKRITYVEGQIRRCRKESIELKNALRRPRQQRLTKEESRHLKESIESLKFQIQDYQYLLYVLRCVGDGIAHIYINKWDIKPLAFKESPGFISGKRGARLERKILRETTRRFGVPVILNDLTNCLRYGDITVPKDGLFLLVEVKSGGRKGLDKRGETQLRKAEEITNYLVTDYATTLYGEEREVFRVGLHRKEKLQTKQLNKLIGVTREGEIRYKKVEEGLLYVVDRGADNKSSLTVALDRAKLSSETIVAFVDPTAHNSYFPLTLSIKNPEALFDIFDRTLLIVIFLDMNVLKREFLKSGITIELLSDEEWFMKLRRNGLGDSEEGVQLMSRHFFSRVFIEFWSLAWLIKEILHRNSRLEEMHEYTNDIRELAKGLQKNEMSGS